MPTINENQQYLTDASRFPKLSSVPVSLPRYQHSSEEYNRIVEYLGQLYERSRQALTTVDSVLDPDSANPISSAAVAEAIARLSVLQSKTYTGIYGEIFYFMSVRPSDPNTPVFVRYRIRASMANRAQGTAQSVMSLAFSPTFALISYDVWNYISNTSYRPFYTHYYHPLKKAGFDAGYGHVVGIGLTSSYQPTSATYARTFQVEILEVQNATVSLFDTMVPYGNVPGTGTTNYEDASTVTASTQGGTHTGDKNDVSYIVSNGSVGPVGSVPILAASLVMQTADGSWGPFTTNASLSTASSKARNTVGFQLGSPIFYCNTASSAGATRVAATLYLAVTLDLRYSTNCAQTLTAHRPVYLVGTLNPTDGLFYLADTWWAQSLPSSDDGKLYIHLGQAYSTYQIQLWPSHDIFYFSDGAVRRFLLAQETDPTVPAWAKQPTKPSYTPQEVGALPASTPIPTKTSDLQNDSGFLTQHQDLSHKQDTITTVNVAVDDSSGTPSGSASVNGHTLNLSLHNLKGGKGDKGDPLTYADLTQAQKDDLAQGAVAAAQEATAAMQDVFDRIEDFDLSDADDALLALEAELTATNQRTSFIRGRVLLAADLDALHSVADAGLYFYYGTGMRGIVSVAYDFLNTVTQHMVASATPVYADGQLTGWVPGTCTIARSYSSGAWSPWRFVDGGITSTDDAIGDLDISDPDGNVLARFENGHLRTRDFYSGNIYTKAQVDAQIPAGIAADAIGDLDISDPDGNVLARFENGHLRTRDFYSGDIYTKAQVNALIAASGGGSPANIATVNGFSLTNGGNVRTSPPYLRWHGKRVGAIGDSITYGYNTTKTYLQYLADELDCTPVNLGSNSSEIAGSSSNGFIARAASIPTNLDLLLILGGVNDFLWASSSFQIGDVYTVSSGSLVMNTDTTTFCGAYNTLLQTIVARIPGKPIYLMTPLHHANFGSADRSSWKKNAAGQTLSQFVEAIKEIGKFWGFPVIDLYNEAGMNPNIEALRLKFFNHYVPDSTNNDSLHPDANGHKRIAETILMHI